MSANVDYVRSATTPWLVEGMAAGLILWLVVSAGFALVASTTSVFALFFLIGVAPAVGLAGVTGVLVAVLARFLPSAGHRQEHLRAVRLLIPAVIAGVFGSFVGFAALTGGEGVPWWPAVALLVSVMGIPGTIIGWLRAPAIVEKYWPRSIEGQPDF